MADTRGPPHESGLEARVARLESDVSEIRSILNRLAPRIDEMYGFLTAKLSELATKAELIDLRAWAHTEFARQRTGFADLRAEMTTELADVRRQMADLRLEIAQRPTCRQSVVDIFAIVGLIGTVLTIAGRLAH